MARFLLILLLGLVLEALGVVLLSKGLRQIGAAPTWGAWLKAAFTNPSLGGGLALEMAFFGILLYLLSHRDVSIVWPLTALGFVITTIMARLALGEQVPPLRWAGVVLIVVGAALVSWTDGHRSQAASVPDAARVIPKSE